MENEYLSKLSNWWGELHYSSLQKRGLSPALAVISVGEGNSYGHPAASTISALTDLHAKVLRTDIDGAVAIRAERHHLSIQRSKRWLRFFFWS
jgi:competence protein ComEC